jgi:GT2 family glycosyltransferase
MNDNPLVSVIVNYFNPNEHSQLEAMIIFTLECLNTCTSYPLELIIADGSGKRSELLANKSQQRGWIYLESSFRETFAQTYNRGMVVATGDYRVWMASDIFVTKGWEKHLIKELERTGAWMAAPYLTYSDYVSQRINLPLKMYTFFPSLITFNLNMITSDCYEKVGLMDEQFSGCFNDVDYLIRIRKAGGEAIIVNAGQILHFTRATTSVNSSVDYDKDMQLFLQKYPEIASQKDWAYGTPFLSKSWIHRQLLFASSFLLRGRLARKLYEFTARIEPLLHKI